MTWKIVLICGIVGLTALTVVPEIPLGALNWLRRTVPRKLTALFDSFFRWVQKRVWWFLSSGILLTVGVLCFLLVRDPPWSPCRIPVEVTFAVSDETAPAVRRAADAFMEDKVNWWGCRGVNVNVSALPADGIRNRLHNWAFPVEPSGGRTPKTPPGARPDGWIADFPEEVDYVRGRRDPKLTLGEPVTVATSPLVIAAPPGLADDLAGDDLRPGAHDWAYLLRPRSSTRRVIRTYPLASNVGLVATAAGPAEGLSEEVRPDDNVHEVMCRYPAGTTAPPVVMTEQQFHEVNLALSGTASASRAPDGCFAGLATVPMAGKTPAGGPSPLTAVYPKGGHALHYICVPTLWSDLERPGSVRRAVEDFCGALRETLPRYGFRDHRGRLDTGSLPPGNGWLKREAPVALDWKAPVISTLYRSRTRLAEHVLLLIDNSGSMGNRTSGGGSRLMAAGRLAQFVVTGRRGEQTTGVRTFFPEDGHDSGPAAVTDEGKSLVERLDAVMDVRPSRPDPEMRSLIIDALDRMASIGGDQDRRVVLVLTDGGDPAGLTAEDLRKRGDVRLVMLSFTGKGCAKRPLPELRDKGLMSCYDASSDPERALDEVFDELRRRR
ncbi:substrate-binding domain-containing protein [Planomonospora sp. ID67723]|uniref:substrate-binding domain-containing protein n=1 Tax=Planomonospora sp. ID67723 TaxID=2738134 RepID=UPI0018C3E57A|nr:substrate-binding domain-containing protein [Planomonospora sp. ID67723]MBG0830929.1 substrate-binding domain-containing protein [Planomonospora sp. ID67723]